MELEPPATGDCPEAGLPTATMPTWCGAEVKTDEVVKLMLDTLQSLGLTQAAAALQAESGVALHPPAVAALRRSVLDGEWHGAAAALAEMEWRSPADAVLAVFLVQRQRYLEALAQEGIASGGGGGGCEDGGSGGASSAEAQLSHLATLVEISNFVRRSRGMSDIASPLAQDECALLFAATPVFPSASAAAAVTPFYLGLAIPEMESKGGEDGTRLHVASTNASARHTAALEGGGLSGGVHPATAISATTTVQAAVPTKPRDADAIFDALHDPHVREMFWRAVRAKGDAAAAHQHCLPPGADVPPSKRRRAGDGHSSEPMHSHTAGHEFRAVIAGVPLRLEMEHPAALPPIPPTPFDEREAAFLQGTTAGDSRTLLPVDPSTLVSEDVLGWVSSVSTLAALSVRLLDPPVRAKPDACQRETAAARAHLLHALERRYAVDVVPPLRLATLLGQAIEYQRLRQQSGGGDALIGARTPSGSFAAPHFVSTGLDERVARHVPPGPVPILRDGGVGIAGSQQQSSHPRRCGARIHLGSPVAAMAVSPDGTLVAAVTSSPLALRVWRVADVLAAGVQPNLVLSTAPAGAVRPTPLLSVDLVPVWTAVAATQMSLYCLRAGIETAAAVLAWSPDASSIAVAIDECCACLILSAIDGRVQHICNTHEECGIGGLASSPSVRGRGTAIAAAAGSPSGSGAATAATWTLVAASVDGGVAVFHLDGAACRAVSASTLSAMDVDGGDSRELWVSPSWTRPTPPAAALCVPHQAPFAILLTHTPSVMYVHLEQPTAPMPEQRLPESLAVTAAASVHASPNGRRVVISSLATPPAPAYKPGVKPASHASAARLAALQRLVTPDALSADGSGSGMRSDGSMSRAAPTSATSRQLALLAGGPGAHSAGAVNADAGLVAPSRRVLLSPYTVPALPARLIVWDVAEGRDIAVLVGHINERLVLTPVMGGPSGDDIVACGSEDGAVCVWSLGTPQPPMAVPTGTPPMATMEGHTAPVTAVAWAAVTAPEGTHSERGSGAGHVSAMGASARSTPVLITAADDGTLRLWTT